MNSNGSANGASHSISITVPLQIDGREIQTSKNYDVRNPATGEVIWKSSAATKKEALAAVEAAEAAFPAWSRTKPSVKRDLFLKASDILSSHSDEFGKFMDDETGSLSDFSKGFNVPTSVEMLRDVAGRVSGITGSIPICGQEGRNALLYKEPFGVIFSIAPWNAPYILGFRAVAYALAAGNTIVLKGSELSPRCFWAIGQVFKEAGLPDGCLNVITHHHEDAVSVTNAIIEHPAIKKINFTGSTHVGSIIAATAGKNLKPVLLELGGKAPSIVLQDADIEKAAHECALGAFLHVSHCSANYTSTVLTVIERPNLYVNGTHPRTLLHRYPLRHCPQEIHLRNLLLQRPSTHPHLLRWCAKEQETCFPSYQQRRKPSLRRP